MCYRQMFVTSYVGKYIDKEGEHDLIKTISGKYKSKESLERAMRVRYPNFTCSSYTSYYAKVSVLLDDYIEAATFIERIDKNE